MYNFILYEDHWGLVITKNEIDKLIELSKLVAKFYFRKFINSAIRDDSDIENNLFYNNILSLARIHNISPFEALLMAQHKSDDAKFEALEKYGKIYVNEAGGFSIPDENDSITKSVSLKTLRFPNYTKDDIRIKQWGGEAKGSHYYAYIGTIEVHNGDVYKWDTFQEAYNEALKYIGGN